MNPQPDPKNLINETWRPLKTTSCPKCRAALVRETKDLHTGWWFTCLLCAHHWKE